MLTHAQELVYNLSEVMPTQYQKGIRTEGAGWKVGNPRKLC